MKPGRPVGTFKNPVRHTDKTYQRWLALKRKPGAVVCRRWTGKGGFNNFFADMGPCEGRTLVVDSVTGNYRWGLRSEVAHKNGWVRNPDSLRQKCLKAGLPYLVVYFRIKRGGWTEQKALRTPVATQGRPAGYRPSEHPPKMWKIS